MSEEVFKAIIAAQDQTAATFEAIIARLHKVETAAHGASHAAHEVTEHAGAFHAFSERVHEMGEHFGELREHIAMAAESAVEFLPALAALGGITSMLGLFEMTEKAAEGFAQFNAAAEKLGISRGQLSGLRYAAQMTDVPIERLDAGLSKLSLTMGQVAGGQNKQAASLFQHLGIEMKDAHGHARTVADIMPELAEAFKRTTDATMRSRMAAALFGARMGKDLLPMLLDGEEGLEKYAAEAKRLKYAVTPEDAEGLEAYHRSMIGLQTAVGGFTTEIAARLAPVLQPIVDATTDWVVANRDWISLNIAERVQAMAKGLGMVDWAGWAAEAHRIGDAMVYLHDAIGTVGVALVGVTVYAAANPFGATVLAIAIAAQEIYNHWGPIRDFFKDLWAAIGDAFSAGWAKIKPIMDALESATDWIGKHMPGGDSGGPSLSTRIRTDVTERFQFRQFPGPRASSERHDHDDPDENRHVVRNWLHDTIHWLADPYATDGVGIPGGVPAKPPSPPSANGTPAADPLAPLAAEARGVPADPLAALAAPPSALLAPPTALTQPGGTAARSDVPPQQIELRVSFDGAPPGMSVGVVRAPAGTVPQIDVGHAMPGFGYGH